MGRPAHAVTLILHSVLSLLMMAGCGSGSASSGRTPSPGEGSAGGYEDTFHPSEFDPPPVVALREKPLPTNDSASTPLLPLPIALEDLVPGFRVQIFSSTDIDEANGIKTTAEERFPGERFYVVYEPPTYKVRAGDFQQRYDADRLAKSLREGGYSDSWIVPDRVQSKPSSGATEPDGAKEPRR